MTFILRAGGPCTARVYESVGRTRESVNYKTIFGLVFIYLQFAKDYIYLKAFCLVLCDKGGTVCLGGEGGVAV